MIFFFEQRRVDLVRRRSPTRATNSLKNGPAEARLQFARQVMRLGQILLRQFAQPLLAVDAS